MLGRLHYFWAEGCFRPALTKLKNNLEKGPDFIPSNLTAYQNKVQYSLKEYNKI